MFCEDAQDRDDLEKAVKGCVCISVMCENYRLELCIGTYIHVLNIANVCDFWWVIDFLMYLVPQHLESKA